VASVEKNIGGVAFHEWLAKTPMVQDVLDETVAPMLQQASSMLAEHRHDGHAFIEVEKADVDRHLILNDQRGLAAAMSIEYGRSADEDGNGGMDGLFILHQATGRRIKLRKRPRRRR
jgi:hypothetical protein